MKPIGVMHLTDTLDLGGYERVAVNLVNYLPPERYETVLCTTRRDGPLATLVADHVERLRLERRRTFDVNALRRLVRLIQERDIRILHAHGASLFTARAASLAPPYPHVVWHAHFGRVAALDRPAWPYRIASHGVAGVIAVNQPLLEWSRRRLHVPEARSWYIPNLVSEPRREELAPNLPGVPGSRIVCVANLRREKDHCTLLHALAITVRRVRTAHLIVVGASPDPAYESAIRQAASDLGLERHITFMGQRTDVTAILRACDIGVLSSTFEGLPMALLEYGMQGLPVVATTAGQCAEVLDGGRAGILVPAAEPDRLAEGLVLLLQSPERRARYGARLRQHVASVYSPKAVMERVCSVYAAVLGTQAVSPAGLPSSNLTTVVSK